MICFSVEIAGGKAGEKSSMVWKLKGVGGQKRDDDTQIGRRLRSGGNVSIVGQPSIKSETPCRGTLSVYLGNLPMSSILGIKYSTMPVTVEFPL